MLKYVQFLHPISGSEARLISITASLSGTSSYIITASSAVNAVGYWNSSSFQGTLTDPSVAGFNTSGRPTLYSSAQNQARLMYRDGTIQWILISVTPLVVNLSEICNSYMC
jgi:hypothetical protein